MTNITSGPAGIVFVEAQRDIVLVGPGQDAVAEFGDLHAVLDDDRVLADEIDAADMAVEVDAHAGPVEARRDLLDMGRLAGAVIARHHDAAVVGKARQDRQRRLLVEQIVRIDVGHMLDRLPNRPAPPSWQSKPNFSFTDTVVSGRLAMSRSTLFIHVSTCATASSSPAIVSCSGAVFSL